LRFSTEIAVGVYLGNGTRSMVAMDS